MPEEAYWNALRLVFDFGIEDFRAMRKHFGSGKKAFGATTSAYKKYGFGSKAIEKLKTRDIYNVNDEWEKLGAYAIELLLFESKQYPARLKEIASPPPLLYYRGDITLASRPNLVAIVGTRRATPYGKQATRVIGTGLAEAGCVIVSGMAFGIDTEAHKAALNANSLTIAVLGSSLDEASIYPQANLPLSKLIAKEGLLLSEHPIPTRPRKEHFPRRNRIVSGLSRGVVIAEATEPSGALITAFFALEQNREVFAVPGSIFNKTSQGCHKLLAMGARLTQNADDVLEELGIVRNTEATKEQCKTLKALSEKPLTFEQIVAATKLSEQEIYNELITLEIQQRVAKNNGMYYKV